MSISSIQTSSIGAERRENGCFGIRTRLRQATAETHAQLDEQFGKFDLRQRSGYRRFLEASAAALLPLEDALVQAGVVHIFPDWASRSRRRAILEDIARIGGVVHPLAVPAKLNFGQVLGTMYVLEGSRLGAHILLKRVSQSTDLVVAATTAYLGHGAHQQLWRSFLVMLERHGATLKKTLSREEDVINGAQQAFALFAQAVQSCIADAGLAQ